MSLDPNVTLATDNKKVTVDGKIKSAKWLDNGKDIKIENGNEFYVEPFEYGNSYSVRVARLEM